MNGEPQIQPQAPPNFFSQNMFFPFPPINNYCENFLSMECILRFGSVLLINTLQCFLSIISRPRQEPRHHTVKSRLTVFPSYFQSKLRPLCILIVPGSSALFDQNLGFLPRQDFFQQSKLFRGHARFFSRYNKGQITYSLLC